MAIKVRIDEPITVAGVANPDGKTVLPLKQFWAEQRKRNRPPKTREHVEHRIEVYERFLAESTAKRAAQGLPPVAEGAVIAGLRAKLAAMPDKPKRKAAAKREAELTPAQRVRDLARRVRDHQREQEAIDAEVRELVSLAPVPDIAKARGVSRQRVYQLAG